MTKKTTDVAHGYRVTDLITWAVPIFRYRIVNFTEKTVTYLDESGTHRIERISNTKHRWFFDYESAKFHAAALLAERRQKLEKLMLQLTNSETDLRKGFVRDIEPVLTSKRKTKK